MKRGTPRHPKVGHLCELLKIKIPTAVGYLELLWHFTAEFAPQGDIGKFADARIEAGIHWSGRPGRLIAALIEAGFIDLIDPSSGPHRLLIHGWCDHADDAVRKRLSRACLKFLSVTPKVTGHQRTSADIGCLPEPEPEPEPDICSSDDERERELFSVDSPPFDTLNENQPPEQSPIWGTKEKRRAFIEGFWAVWPRRIAKAAAEKAWCKLANSPGVADRIIAAVRAQLPALSKDLQFCPYPATWLNEKRYEDDPAEASAPSNVAVATDDYPEFHPEEAA